MQPLKCRHKGCKNTHKSSTGYCADHVEEGVRHEIRVPKGGRVGSPLLQEEYTEGFHWPKVI